MLIKNVAAFTIELPALDEKASAVSLQPNEVKEVDGRFASHGVIGSWLLPESKMLLEVKPEKKPVPEKEDKKEK